MGTSVVNSIFNWRKFQYRKKYHFGILTIAALSLSLKSCHTAEGDSWTQIPTYPVIEIEKGNYASNLSYPTYLQGIQEIEIRPKVAGYIEEILVDEGQFVEKGQTLFRLESNALSQTTRASKAAIESAQSSVEVAEIEVQKLQPLVEQKIVSKTQLETAKANLEVAKAKLNTAQNTYLSNKANEDYTLITSPVNGVIGKLNFRLGALVNPNNTLALTTLSNTEEMYAYFSVGENELNQITKDIQGKSLTEKLAQIPGLSLQTSNGNIYPLQGKLEASTGKINYKTGAIQLRARFSNPNQHLLSGNSGKILIPQNHTGVIAVPALSTFEIQGMRMVYVLNDSNVLEARPIQVKEQSDRYFILAGGVHPKEKILAQGVHKIYPNTMISPYTVSMDSLVQSFQTVFK